MIYPDDHPPPHVHAIGSGCVIRIGLEPLLLLSSIGAKAGDIRRAMTIAKRRREELVAAWTKYHG
jgi:hypothetical protein